MLVGMSVSRRFRRSLRCPSSDSREAMPSSGPVEASGRLYAEGTSGASDVPGRKIGAMTRLEDAARQRCRCARCVAGDRRAGRSPTRRRRPCARKAANRDLQPGSRAGARDLPPGGRRRPPGRRRLSRPGERAVAEHHVPPRQHDGRRLPRPRQPAEAPTRCPPPPEAVAGVQRRAREGARAGAQAARRRTRATPTRTISSAPPSACARPTPPPSRAASLGAFRAAREAYDEHEKVLDARQPPQGRRPHRRHLPLHRRGAVAAAALVAYVAGFGGGKETGHASMIEDAAAYRRRQPGRRAARAGPALQPRAALRRCAEAAGDAAGAVSAQPAGVARDAARRTCAPAGRPTPSAS